MRGYSQSRRQDGLWRRWRKREEPEGQVITAFSGLGRRDDARGHFTRSSSSFVQLGRESIPVMADDDGILTVKPLLCLSAVNRRRKRGDACATRREALPVPPSLISIRSTSLLQTATPEIGRKKMLGPHSLHRHGEPPSSCPFAGFSNHLPPAEGQPHIRDPASRGAASKPTASNPPTPSSRQSTNHKRCLSSHSDDLPQILRPCRWSCPDSGSWANDVIGLMIQSVTPFLCRSRAALAGWSNSDDC